MKTKLLGREIDHFSIQKLLGTGGMGEVYLAWDRHLERDVALKVFYKNASISCEEDYQQLFREAKIAASIQHPNVVSIYGVGEASDLAYISMEYVKGCTFDVIIQQEPLPEMETWMIALKLCEAMQAALQKGIIHRDIKPGNLLVDTHSVVKVADFGLSRKVGQNRDIKLKGMVFGTPNYMSPEQSAGKRLDYRTDIYSLGATLYHFFTGKTLFSGDSAREIFKQHQSELIPAPQNYVPSLHVETSGILGKMLQKKPSARYQNYQEIIEDIQAFLEKKSIPHACDSECFEIYQDGLELREKKTGRIKGWTRRISNLISNSKSITDPPSWFEASKTETLRIRVREAAERREEFGAEEIESSWNGFDLEEEVRLENRKQDPFSISKKVTKKLSSEEEEKTKVDKEATAAFTMPIETWYENGSLEPGNKTPRRVWESKNGGSPTPVAFRWVQPNENNFSWLSSSQDNAQSDENCTEVKLNLTPISPPPKPQKVYPSLKKLLAAKTQESSALDEKEARFGLVVDDLMKNMLEELNEMIFAALVGKDGLVLMQPNSDAISLEEVLPKLTQGISLVQNSTREMKFLGELQEHLVQAGNAWILSRPLNEDYYLCVSMGRDGSLDGFRRVAQNFSEEIQMYL